MILIMVGEGEAEAMSLLPSYEINNILLIDEPSK